MAWGKAGSTTLGSAGVGISSGTITASKCNQSITHISDVGGQLAVDMRFNNDTGNNYAFRRNNDGGTDGTTTSTSHITLHSSEVTEDLFSNLFIINISAQEKLVIGHTIQNHTVGTGVTPKRKQFIGKWTNTSSQITEIAFSSYSGSGDYDTGSNLTVLGSDITPASAITFPENVQVGSRAEITDTRKMYYYSDPLTFESDFSSASGWTASDSNDIGVANGKLNWYNNGTNTYENAYYDLGAVSDTKWILRHTLKVSGTPSSDEIPYQFIISNTANANWNTDSACLGVWIYVDRNNAWRRIYTSNKASGTGGGDSGAQASPRYWSDFAYDTTYYITTTRTSATNMTVEIRTGSHSGSIVSNGTLTLTIPSGITGLRYLTANQGAQGTGLSMEVDDVEFYNDTTSTDIAWKELGT